MDRSGRERPSVMRCCFLCEGLGRAQGAPVCGIVALFSPRGRIERENLERATHRLVQRGPDGQRTWIAPHGRAGLGHARLSIIDLRTGDQPIASEDGRTHIVVNGEFYDFERIQRELESRGHRLRTRSDSEIALHLYEELGTQCLHQLRGEFAFVLWDEANRTLFAARDRFGIKPLFYAVHDGTLYLASEVKALFAAGVPARWDAESVFASLSNSAAIRADAVRGRVPGPAGPLPDRDRRARRSCIRYWDFDYPDGDTARCACDRCASTARSFARGAR